MAVLGLKLTMFLGSLTYALYVTSFFHLTNWFYYLTAVVNGIGAGLLWPASVRYNCKSSVILIIPYSDSLDLSSTDLPYCSDTLDKRKCHCNH